jgi:hypothetical protein
VHGLIVTVSADNLSAGIATSAFVAYLSGLTNVAYSATQHALFSPVMLLPKFLAGFSGVVDPHEYATSSVRPRCSAFWWWSWRGWRAARRSTGDTQV